MSPPFWSRQSLWLFLSCLTSCPKTFYRAYLCFQQVLAFPKSFGSIFRLPDHYRAQSRLFVPPLWLFLKVSRSLYWSSCSLFWVSYETLVPISCYAVRLARVSPVGTFQALCASFRCVDLTPRCSPRSFEVCGPCASWHEALSPQTRHQPRSFECTAHQRPR